MRTIRKQHGAGRHWAILLGGIAGGIIGGRLLPPLYAALTAASRARTGGDPFAPLIEDHRKLLTILDQMMKTTSGSKLQRGPLFFALKRKLGKHAMAEEDVVYPLVQSDSAEGDQRKELYDDHADMKILLYQIESQLMAGEDWGSTVAELRRIVRSHAEEEENTIFPELRRQLEESELPRVAGKISREEALLI